ncbi:hypothetical protein NC652_030057 [Populus alba x Populus x berolinensis]|nr:hypothetical protein NC652_030057 [Populus alba x Populus x berolinensis]
MNKRDRGDDSRNSSSTDRNAGSQGILNGSVDFLNPIAMMTFKIQAQQTGLQSIFLKACMAITAELSDLCFKVFSLIFCLNKLTIDLSTRGPVNLDWNASFQRVCRFQPYISRGCIVHRNSDLDYLDALLLRGFTAPSSDSKLRKLAGRIEPI